MSVPPPTVLLCESCGYTLAGLPFDGECPECGRPIEHSLPARRHGSPAQQRRSWSAWVETGTRVLNDPKESFRRASIERRRARGLLLTSTFVAAILSSTALVAVAATLFFHIRAFDVPGAALTIALFTAGAWATILIASWIESLGIRFFGARRGWRITKTVSLVVVAHAAIGWVAGGIVVGVGALLALVSGLLGRESADSVVIAVAVGGLVMGAVVGLLWFEMLVYTGVRACRFANPPGADVASLEHAPQPPTGASVLSSEPAASGDAGPNGYDASATPGEAGTAAPPVD